ncbi:MAG: hypothetical protein ABIQ40_05040 [Bacteroidia bacterium]
MADKKKIKNIKDGTGSGDGAQITVGDLTATHGNAAPDQTFEQIGYKALCFNIDDIINTESITVPGSSTAVIINARRIQRGTVLTLNDDNTGTIEENKSLKKINFKHPHAKDLGISVDAEVKYDLVRTSSGGEIAVNVQLLA